MLIALQIQNIALVKKLELAFDSGLTTITGETGAGKSVILKALSLALGERTDAGMIRLGQNKASVSALFDIRHNEIAKAWLDEQSIDYDDMQCQLRRVIELDKPSKAYVNGVAVTAGALKELSDALIEIQGQNQHQQITATKWQRQTLDQWLKNPELLTQLESTFQHYQQIEEKIEQLKTQTVSQIEIDFIQTQINELEKLSPLEGEYAELDMKQRNFHHFQQFKDDIAGALTIIEGDPDNDLPGLTGLLTALNLKLKNVSNIQKQPDLAEDADSASAGTNPASETEPDLLDKSAQIDLLLSDLSIALNQQLRQHADDDLQSMQEIEDRLSLYFSLSRKHKVAPEFLAARFNELSEKLDQFSNADAHLQALNEEKQKTLKEYHALADKVHKQRSAAAGMLSEKVTREIQELGLTHGHFSVNIEKTEQIRSHGTDKITFQVRINKGSLDKPLDKAASGGELSRIFLATQIVLTQKFSGKTIIYDEIDSGIGGKTASIVGQKLKTLAQNYQVLCITHLAQVAGYGKQQLLVSKAHEAQETSVEFHLLENKARIEELARMVSGEVNDASLKTAESLLMA